MVKYSLNNWWRTTARLVIATLVTIGLTLPDIPIVLSVAHTQIGE